MAKKFEETRDAQVSGVVYNEAIREIKRLRKVIYQDGQELNKLDIQIKGLAGAHNRRQ